MDPSLMHPLHACPSRVSTDRPEWLTEDLLEAMLPGGGGWRVEPASSHGDNQVSSLMRVSRGRSSVIVKLQIPGPLDKIINEMDMFNKERDVYGGLGAAVEEVVGCRLVPRGIHVNPLVIEDLTPLGYFNEDRLSLLSPERLSQALQWLGRWHGGSHLALLKKPEAWKAARKDTFSPSSEMRIIYSILVSCLAQAAAGWPETSHLANRLVAYMGSSCDKMAEELNANIGPQVLVHGDLHTNNLMFIKDGDPLVIDFQFCVANNPAMDLLYLLWTSARDDALDNLQSTLQPYVDAFNSIKGAPRMTVPGVKALLESFPHFQLHLVVGRGVILLGPEGFNMGVALSQGSVQTVFDSPVGKSRVIRAILSAAETIL